MSAVDEGRTLAHPATAAVGDVVHGLALADTCPRPGERLHAWGHWWVSERAPELGIVWRRLP